MFHRGSLSVVLKSKKLFGEGDVGYAMWVMGKFLRLGKFSMREIVRMTICKVQNQCFYEN